MYITCIIGPTYIYYNMRECATYVYCNRYCMYAVYDVYYVIYVLYIYDMMYIIYNICIIYNIAVAKMQYLFKASYTSSLRLHALVAEGRIH